MAALLVVPLVYGIMSGTAQAQGQGSGQIPGQGPVGSFVVVDLFTKKILAGREINQRRQIASITKVATAVVVLDWMELTGVGPGTQATVPQSAALIGGGNPLGMRPGDRIALRDALYAALIGSDNVAAETLATFVGADLLRRAGKSGHPIGHFVEQMNALASKHGMAGTKFTNPHGMDGQKPIPYSTAADVARLSIVAMEKAGFRFYVAQAEREIGFHRGGEKLSFLVKNTNQLVREKGIDGVKTGQTNLAGPCVVISGEKPPVVREGPGGQKEIIPHRLVVVVLGAQNRFPVAATLLQQGWAQFEGWNAAGRPVNAPDELLSMQRTPPGR
ncbi:hypothetical protein BH23VER1_BH23VER1_33830 [soil metagenome]